MTLSKSERLSPFLEASSDFTVASSYLWSPAITTRFAYLKGIQQAGSMDWAHSSMMQTSKRLSGREYLMYRTRVLSEAEVRVQKMT
jgi:hypothetical protein